MNTPAANETPSEGYEHSDVRPAVVGRWGLLLVASLIGVLGFIAWLVGVLGADAASGTEHPLAGSRPAYPAPRLQVDPEVDRAAYAERMRRETEEYGWEDRAAGRVRIPVDRALQLVAERGLPSLELDPQEKP